MPATDTWWIENGIEKERWRWSSWILICPKLRRVNFITKQISSRLIQPFWNTLRKHLRAIHCCTIFNLLYRSLLLKRDKPVGHPILLKWHVNATLTVPTFCFSNANWFIRSNKARKSVLFWKFRYAFPNAARAISVLCPLHIAVRTRYLQHYQTCILTLYLTLRGTPCTHHVHST